MRTNLLKTIAKEGAGSFAVRRSRRRANAVSEAPELESIWHKTGACRGRDPDRKVALSAALSPKTNLHVGSHEDRGQRLQVFVRLTELSWVPSKTNYEFAPVQNPCYPQLYGFVSKAFVAKVGGAAPWLEAFGAFALKCFRRLKRPEDRLSRKKMELQTIVIQIIVVTADSAAARASVIRASASVVRDMAVSMARGRFVAESRPGASMTLHSVPLGRPSDDAHSGRLTTWRLRSSMVASERAT